MPVASALPCTKVTTELLLEQLQLCGMLGMSGNGYLVADKILTFIKARNSAKQIIVNAIECEPGLKNDEWLLHHRMHEIAEGIRYLSNALSITDITLAVKESIQITEDGFLTVKVPARFPMGEEHYLYQAVTGKSLERTVIPAKQGILIMNVQTVYQIYRMLNHVYDNQRIVTLADISSAEGRIAIIHPEDQVQELLHKAFPEAKGNIYYGGGILQASQVTDQQTFGTRGGFAAFAPDSNITNENRCRKCGGCSHKCPAGISVHKIVQALEKDANADISAFHPEKCVHCESCTYFCMGNKIPSQYVNREI